MYYLIYAYAIVTLIAGLIILTKGNGKSKKPLRIATPYLLLLLIPVLFMLNKALVLLNAPQPFLLSDMAMLYAIAVFESCIRGRLIMYNEDYAGLFGKTAPDGVVFQ